MTQTDESKINLIFKRQGITLAEGEALHRTLEVKIPPIFGGGGINVRMETNDGELSAFITVWAEGSWLHYSALKDLYKTLNSMEPLRYAECSYRGSPFFELTALLSAKKETDIISTNFAINTDGHLMASENGIRWWYSGLTVEKNKSFIDLLKNIEKRHSNRVGELEQRLEITGKLLSEEIEAKKQLEIELDEALEVVKSRSEKEAVANKKVKDLEEKCINYKIDIAKLQRSVYVKSSDVRAQQARIETLESRNSRLAEDLNSKCQEVDDLTATLEETRSIAGSYDAYSGGIWKEQALSPELIEKVAEALFNKETDTGGISVGSRWKAAVRCGYPSVTKYRERAKTAIEAMKA
jgi:hypothetical protein